MTARVVKRAVDNNETSFNLLKARLRAFGHITSERRFMTARVVKRAVANIETTFYLLLLKNWYKQDLPSSNIKINKGDCFIDSSSSRKISRFSYKRAGMTAYGT